MQNNISYIVTNGGITAVIDGEQYTVAQDNPVYGQVRDAIADREPASVIADLFRTAAAIRRYTGDQVVVTNGSLYYNGEEIHNVVVDRILEFMTLRLPVEPLIGFLTNLLANPSRRATDELYKFLEHKNLPITEDGCFLAYKAVRSDYSDKHTGTFFNHVGAILEMPRQKVDDDARRGCSYGFHAGSLEYASGFASYDDRLVLVKINPADVVSVPFDCDCQKLRTAKYEVVSDYRGALYRPLVTGNNFYDEDAELGEDYDLI